MDGLRRILEVLRESRGVRDGLGESGRDREYPKGSGRGGYVKRIGKGLEWSGRARENFWSVRSFQEGLRETVRVLEDPRGLGRSERVQEGLEVSQRVWEGTEGYGRVQEAQKGLKGPEWVW